MSIRALLIDDEQHNLDNLGALLRAYCPEVDVVGTALNATGGKEQLLNLKPDLLFLDIQMPGTSGFDLLRSLGNLDLEVIFVTAYDGYAIQAMRFSAVDYLLKPVDIAELQAAVERAIKQRKLKVQNAQLENLIHLLQHSPQRADHRIALATLGETRFVKTAEIIRCESSNNYTTFYLIGGSSLIVSRPIYEFEDLLRDYGFIRCHQSHLVNRAFVKSLKKDGGDSLIMDDGKVVPISRSRKDVTKEILRL